MMALKRTSYFSDYTEPKVVFPFKNIRKAWDHYHQQWQSNAVDGSNIYGWKVFSAAPSNESPHHDDHESNEEELVLFSTPSQVWHPSMIRLKKWSEYDNVFAALTTCESTEKSCELLRQELKKSMMFITSVEGDQTTRQLRLPNIPK
jgi:hypothetical protein